ncbi:DUF2812 domain-containing protein [Halobacillus locisalis]|uniref:DUF2812 domain-containing protein n=1 Tax=Halobacillus locisalis TaxID=220753 RepID=A0A838CWB1_9BACI|nr:DUF2812 domain-containing protein [Halobacillus locisalis]MBA2176250.1 DUF2812 domain-containing protein [Halobacillus locisalis]
MKKRIFRLFFAWQDQAEEKWLTEMAEQGFHFSKYKFGLYTFKKAEAADYVYKLDYKGSSDQDLEEYVTFFEDAGWEHVDRFHGWHYFRKVKNGSEEEPVIYSDRHSESQKYKSLVNFLIPIFLMTVAIFLTIIVPNRPNASMIEVMKWLYIVLISMYVFAIVRVRLKVRKLQK